MIKIISEKTSSGACSMQGDKFESETFKQLIGGSTASYACSMQEVRKYEMCIGGNGVYRWGHTV